MQKRAEAAFRQEQPLRSFQEAQKRRKTAVTALRQDSVILSILRNKIDI